MPCRIILFTVHNNLTKRDYTYSIDDLCDLGIATCVAVWIYVKIKWTTTEPYSTDPNGPPVTNDDEHFANLVYFKTTEGEF